MQTLWYAVATLACPVGLGLMMRWMGRNGRRDGGGGPEPALVPPVSSSAPVTGVSSAALPEPLSRP